MSSFKEKYLPLIRTLKLEPFIIVYFIGYSVKLLTTTQLYQDKLCIVDHKYDVDFCRTLNATNDLLMSRKSKILAESAQYTLYQSLITTFPVIFTTLFVGSWIDKNRNAVKIFGILMIVGVTFEALFLILNAYYFNWTTSLVLISFIPTAICGSHTYALMAAYSFVPKTTPEHLRPIRFSLIDSSFMLGVTVGQCLGGYLIALKPLVHGSLRNYIGVFLVTAVCNCFCLFWMLIAFRERKKELLIKYEDEEQTTSDTLAATNTSINAVHDASSPNVDIPLSRIFDWQGARDTVLTCFKKRPNSARLQLWLIISAMYIYDMIVIGQAQIGFQFAERVFDWDEPTYSNVSAICSIWTTISMAILTYVFVRRFKLGDLLIAIIGIVSAIAMMTLRGAVLTPGAFFFSLLIGSAVFIAPVGIRSAISNLVSGYELGKVMSTVTALESTVQATSTFVFTVTLKLVIHREPGLLYELLAIPLLYPLVIFVVVELCFRKTVSQPAIEEHTEDQIQQISNVESAPINECDA